MSPLGDVSLATEKLRCVEQEHAKKSFSPASFSVYTPEILSVEGQKRKERQGEKERKGYKLEMPKKCPSPFVCNKVAGKQIENK